MVEGLGSESVQHPVRVPQGVVPGVLLQSTMYCISTRFCSQRDFATYDTLELQAINKSSSEADLDHIKSEREDPATTPPKELNTMLVVCVSSSAANVKRRRAIRRRLGDVSSNIGAGCSKQQPWQMDQTGSHTTMILLPQLV